MSSRKGHMSKKASIKLATGSTVRRKTARQRDDLLMLEFNNNVNNWTNRQLFKKAYEDLNRNKWLDSIGKGY